MCACKTNYIKPHNFLRPFRPKIQLTLAAPALSRTKPHIRAKEELVPLSATALSGDSCKCHSHTANHV